MRKRWWLGGAVLLIVGARVWLHFREINVRPMPPSPAAATDAFGDALPPFAVARIGSVRFRGAAFGLGWTDGGTALVSCGEDGVVRVFDAETGLVRREFVAHRGVVEPGGSAGSPVEAARRVFQGRLGASIHDRAHAAAVSRNGSRIVTAGPASVCVWDVATGARVSTWRGSEATALDLAVSDDGRVVACGGYNGALVVRDASDGRRIRLVRPRNQAKQAEWVKSVALSADGALVAYTAETVHLVEVATGREIGTGATGTEGGALAFSPSGDTLVHGTSRDRVVVDGKWSTPLVVRDAATFAVRRESDAMRWDAWSPIEFRADGGLLACAGSALCVFDPATGACVRSIDVGWEETRAMAWSPDGRTLAALCDGVIRAWDATTGAELHPPAPPAAVSSNFGLSADGSTAAVMVPRGSLALFDARTGAFRRTIVEAEQRPFWFGFALSPDGGFVTTWNAAQPMEARTWSAADGRETGRRAIGKWSNVAWDSPPSITHRRGGGVVDVIDSATGASVAIEGVGDATSPVVTPDGRLVVAVDAGGEDGVTVWDRATGKRTAVYRLPVTATQIGALSGDSRAMAVAEGRRVVVVEIGTGRRLGGFDAPEADWPLPLALSPDAQVAALGGADGAVVLHDVATGDVVATLPGHRGRVSRLVFSADGRTLATSADTILVWDVSAWTGAK